MYKNIHHTNVDFFTDEGMIIYNLYFFTEERIKMGEWPIGFLVA